MSIRSLVILAAVALSACGVESPDEAASWERATPQLERGAVLTGPSSPSAVEDADRGDAEVEVHDDCCDEYNACIDACAAAHVSDFTFCADTFPDDVKALEGCNALADKLYEDCIDACPERPPGC